MISSDTDEHASRRLELVVLLRVFHDSAIRMYSALLLALTIQWSVHGQVTIEVGGASVFPPVAGWFQGQIRSFEEAHPGVLVKTVGLSAPFRPIGGRVQELPRLPDHVVGIQGMTEDETGYLADGGYIVPIDDFLPDDDLSLDAFAPSLLDSVRHNGKVWGIPWSADAMWLFCNWPLFEAAGIDSPPSTWEEFASVAQRLTMDTDGDGRLDQIGARIDPGLGLQEFLFWSLNEQDDVQYVRDGKVVFNQPAVLENLSFLSELVRSPYVDSDLSLTMEVSGGGQVGMMVLQNFAQYTSRLPEAMMKLFQDKDLRVAPLPSSGRPGFIATARLFLAVRRSSPEEERASWEFIKWIVRRDAPPPATWYGVPARRDVWNEPHIERWASGFCQDFRMMAELSGNGIHPQLVFKQSSLTVVPQILRGVWTGERDPADALVEMDQRAEEIARPRAASSAEPDLFN